MGVCVGQLGTKLGNRCGILTVYSCMFTCVYACVRTGLFVQVCVSFATARSACTVMRSLQSAEFEARRVFRMPNGDACVGVFVETYITAMCLHRATVAVTECLPS